MYDIPSDIGTKWIVFSIILELIFLCSCVVFIGLGVTELKKGKSKPRNLALIAIGVALAMVSVVATILLIEG